MDRQTTLIAERMCWDYLLQGAMHAILIDLESVWDLAQIHQTV